MRRRTHEETQSQRPADTCFPLRGAIHSPPLGVRVKTKRACLIRNSKFPCHPNFEL